ncbi:replication factor C large subunit [Candidatus Woesearchaeota archaeon]|nr:replication factor C large subunit [Candidatus Woesearchaeota archaeon]
MEDLWVNKYLPKKVSDVHGQDAALKQLKDFAFNFKNKKKRAAIIYGPAGSGKTAAAYAIANELGLEIVETSASDFRNEEQINLKVGNAVHQMSLFSKGKIILIDEIDGLSGNEDRGGIQAIIKLIEKTTFPIILISNDPWGNKFSSLRSKSELIQFKSLDILDVFTVLKKIASEEGIKYEEPALKSLARRAGGDLRAAITDLQMLAEERKELIRKDVEDVAERNKQESILNALVKVFKIKDANIAVAAFENVDEDIDKCFLWVDENLPKEYTDPEDLANAYDMLSKADVLRGRAGVAVSKKQKNSEFIKYCQTTRILKLWHAKMKYMKRKEIAKKIALKTHSSQKEIIKDTLPYMQVIFRKNKKEAERIADYLDLNEEEKDWLMGK